MKLLLSFGALTLGLSLLLAGCGAGNACEQEADAATAKDAECKVTKSTSTGPKSDDSVCPDLFAKEAVCDKACIEDVSCDGYTARDMAAWNKYTDCRLGCF